MRATRERFIPGYIKVTVKSRSPKQWGWDLYREGNDTPVERSAELFRHADDAWKAGQAALKNLEPLQLSELMGVQAQSEQFEAEFSLLSYSELA